MLTGLFAKLAWSEIRGPLLKAAPWIGLVLAVLIGWHAFAVYYRAQGRAESAAVIAGDRIAMQRGVDAINALRGALRTQNAAIDNLRADGDARARFALAQRDAALKANKALSDQARALRSSAGRHYSSTEPCASSAALMNAKDL